MKGKRQIPPAYREPAAAASRWGSPVNWPRSFPPEQGGTDRPVTGEAAMQLVRAHG